MKLKYLLVGGAVALMSCSDSTSSNTSGAVAFSFTGAGVSGTGSFSATGSAPTNEQSAFGSSSWAAGENVSQFAELDVIGVQPRTNSTWDITGITIARNTVGSSSIDPNCTATSCTDVTIFFGSDAAENSYSFACSLTSGTVIVTSITNTRAAGTFSGSGTCQTSATSNETAFTITSGSFDVALTSNVFE